MARSQFSYRMLIISFAAAMVLTIVPLPDTAEWFRPYWVAMFVIYWSIEAPGMMTMGLAFTVGILLDFLTGTLLGQHALGLVIMTYIVQRFRLRLRFFRLWQQAIVVLVVLLNDRIIYTWIHALVYGHTPGWWILIAPFVAMGLWPWLILIMDLIRRQARSAAS